MKIIKSGHQIIYQLILMILLFFQCVSLAHAQQRCDENFSELNGTYLQDILSGLNKALQAGENPEGVLD